jgi:hypothetical protein
MPSAWCLDMIQMIQLFRITGVCLSAVARACPVRRARTTHGVNFMTAVGMHRCSSGILASVRQQHVQCYVASNVIPTVLVWH